MPSNILPWKCSRGKRLGLTTGQAPTLRACRSQEVPRNRPIENAEIGFEPSVVGSSTSGLLIRGSQVRALVGEHPLATPNRHYAPTGGLLSYLIPACFREPRRPSPACFAQLL